ncbi:MAG TPA: ABC transporter ATP-binding protein [Candidatus Hydrothermia bacterium]|nr:ABC transporter ATP-binding protein [Candidatus Hydrothermia bacterium]HOL24239.1 ABC transporter ATP-binding protein [Candidatus Hydrothermia bacterium]HPO79190.1 ABC transporter ATP-binding protein [Candidatus Hydrothermia bacterium]
MKGIITRLLKYKWSVLLGILCLLIVDGAQLIIPLIVRQSVNLLQSGQATTKVLGIYALYILGLTLIIAILRFFWRYFIIGTARKVESDLREELYHHFIRLSASFFNKEKTGELMALITNDTDAVRMASSMGLVQLTDIIVYSTFSLAIMFSISPSLTIYALLPLPLLSILISFSGRLNYRYFKEVQETFSHLTEKIRESITGIKVLKGFSQTKGQLQDIGKTNEIFFKENMKLAKVSSLFEPAIQLGATLSFAILLYFGGRRVILNEISLGDFVAFSSYLGMMIWPMIAIGFLVNIVQRGSASMHRIESALKIEPEIKNLPTTRKVEIQGNIEVKNLTFSYVQDRPVLININFTLKKGRKLGIIGKTGSGKSTICYLIPRIFDPPEGTIFIEETDVKYFDLTDLRNAISFVPQESLLFSTTIKENVSYGKSPASDEEIIKALKLAEVYEEVMAMPEGINTLVGERGLTLSGGQKQRVAIARAIIKNAPIFILDDALSAVDTETEIRILNNLKEFLKNKTTIIVSHRVSAIMDCDEIIVLEDGKIVDRGSHEELLTREGFYKHIYELQKLEEGVVQ